MQSGKFGSALVALAASCELERHVEAAKLLLDSGADPKLPLMGGTYGSALESLANVPRHMDRSEAMEVRIKLLDVLLEAGADPTAVFDRGEHGSALVAAAFYGEKDLLRVMIDHVGVEQAINTLRQSRYPDGHTFEYPEDVERRNDTAAYLANEVGISKDDLDGIGLWAQPVPNLWGPREIPYDEHGEESDGSTFGTFSDGSSSS